MSLSAAVLDAMVATGCSGEQIAAVVKASNAEDDARAAHKREVDAARKRRQREASHAMSRGNERTDADGAGHPQSPLSLDKEIPPVTPKETKPNSPLPPKSAGAFEEFWALFPNKVGKGDASKAFVRAAGKVPLETLMAGLARYVAKTDDRPWCNPATWLNQERWADEPPVPVARAGPQPRSNPLSDAFGLMDKLQRAENDRHDPLPTENTVLYLPAASR